MISRALTFDDWNIGLKISVNDKIALVPLTLKDSSVDEVERVLKVKTYKISALGTNLIGVFIILTNDFLIYPSILDISEINELKKISEENNLQLLELDTKLTAIANNILIINDKALINPNFEKKVEETLKEYFSEVVRWAPKSTEVIGELVVSDGKSALLSNLLTPEEGEFIKEFFKLNNINYGTVNFGNPFLKSGMVLNSKSILVGKITTGPELLVITETFPDKNE